MKYAFMIILTLKTLAFDVGTYGYVRRYYETNKQVG